MSNFVEKIIETDNEIRSCKECGDMVERFFGITSVSFGKSNEFLFVGDTPLKKPNNLNYSYPGNAKLITLDKTIRKLLEILNLDFDEIYYIEAMKCMLLNKKDIDKCIFNCKNFLLKQISLINPNVIITLGDKATKSLLEYKDFDDVVGLPIKIIINDEIKFIVPLHYPTIKKYLKNKKIIKKLKKQSFILEEVNTLKRKLY